MLFLKSQRCVFDSRHRINRIICFVLSVRTVVHCMIYTNEKKKKKLVTKLDFLPYLILIKGSKLQAGVEISLRIYRSLFAPFSSRVTKRANKKKSNLFIFYAIYCFSSAVLFTCLTYYSSIRFLH